MHGALGLHAGRTGLRGRRLQLASWRLGHGDRARNSSLATVMMWTYGGILHASGGDISRSHSSCMGLEAMAVWR